MESLDKPPFDINHPLRDVSKELKHKFLSSSRQESFVSNMIKLETFLEEKSEQAKLIYDDFPVDDEASALAPDKYMQFQTALRLTNLHYYCKNLKEISLHDSTEIPSDISPEHVKYVIDSFLLGSGPERTAGHLRMIGNSHENFTQGLLQSSYYSILEPEVATASEACRLVLASSKDHVKAIKKVTPIYLLDKLELNVKSRCVFAWSDPKYAGYQPLDDDQVVSAPHILQRNFEFFPESTSLGKEFVLKYISERQMKYHDANETTSNLKYGAVFFVFTCIIDQYLGIM